MKNVFVLLMFVVLFSCQNDTKSPETAVKGFVEMRFDNVVTKKDVLERVTGKLQQNLESTSDEDFKKFSDMSNMEKGSFKILDKKCEEKQCFITYSLSYKTKTEDKTTSATDMQKIAELQNVDGKWLIADVSNVKTVVESMEPINPLE